MEDIRKYAIPISKQLQDIAEKILQLDENDEVGQIQKLSQQFEKAKKHFSHLQSKVKQSKD